MSSANKIAPADVTLAHGEQPMTRKLTAAIKLRLVRPIDRDWDEVGARLRALAYLGHRVLNGTMSRLAMAAELPEHVPGEWKSRENPKSEKRPGGKPSSYQMTARSIERANEERIKVRVCKWCAGTGVEPPDPPLKRMKKQPERAPGETCSRCDGVRSYVIGEAVEVPSEIHAGWDRMASRRHMADRGDVIRGAKSIATYRAPAPIAVTSSGQAFSLGHDGRGYTLDVPLYAGGKDGRVRFAVRPDGNGAWAHLRRMLGAKLGDLKIVNAGKKWIAIVSYSWEEEIAEAGSHPDATIALADDGSPEIRIAGRRAKRLYEGSSIQHQRRVFSARRKSRSKHQRDIGKGARGHGRTRALAHYHAVDDAEQRWLRSISQEISAKAVKEAKLRGCRGVVVDESVGDVLRLGVLRDALTWALKRNGFADPTEQSLAASNDGAGADR